MDRSMARKSKDDEIQTNTEAADPQGKVRPKEKGGGKKRRKKTQKKKHYYLLVVTQIKLPQ